MRNIKIYESFDDKKCTVIMPPKPLVPNSRSIFLAGSIEMDKAEDWQTRVIGILQDENLTLFNPRRDDWDSSWEQKITDDNFREQVSWEMDAMDMSDVILVYISPDTKSPITLMELGMHASSGKVLVCCPEGFWRKGNVDMVCARYSIPMYSTLEELVAAALTKIKTM